MSSRVAVSLLIHGHPNYYISGINCVRSIMHYSDFDIFVMLGRSKKYKLPADGRIKISYLEDLSEGQHRSKRFLYKFIGLKQCIESGTYDIIVQLDADALFALPINAKNLIESLDNFQLGMVEQKTILGSNMSRIDFYNHYLKHSLPLIDPNQIPPVLDRFRYYNSGVVIGKTAEMYRLLSWAMKRINELEALEVPSQIGEHMIADQDYFQFWTNNINPDCCVELPWYWNHCDLWDNDFPNPEARIVHFSNFCLGPDRRSLRKINSFARKKLPAVGFKASSSLLKKIWWSKDE
jgi:hypothetical protein